MSEELKRRGRLAAALMAGPAVTVGMLGAGAAPALAQEEPDPKESVSESESEGDSDGSANAESNEEDASSDGSTEGEGEGDDSGDGSTEGEGDDGADGSDEDTNDESDPSNDDESGDDETSSETSESDSDDGSEETVEGEDGDDDVDPADVNDPETEPAEFTTFQEDAEGDPDSAQTPNTETTVDGSVVNFTGLPSRTSVNAETDDEPISVGSSDEEGNLSVDMMEEASWLNLEPGENTVTFSWSWFDDEFEEQTDSTEVTVALEGPDTGDAAFSVDDAVVTGEGFPEGVYSVSIEAPSGESTSASLDEDGTMSFNAADSVDILDLGFGEQTLTFTWEWIDEAFGQQEDSAEVAVTALPPLETGEDVDAEEIVAGLVGDDTGVEGVTTIGDNVQVGQFAGWDALGIPAGVALSTGNLQEAWAAITGRGSGNVSDDLQGPGDDDLDAIIDDEAQTQDAGGMEFSFVPEENYVQFSYVFASEEYGAAADYNDVFAFLVNGENHAVFENADGETLPVSIDTINHETNPEFFNGNQENEDGETPHESNVAGFTTVMTFTAPVNPGELNTLKLVTGDTNDGVFDSMVFLQGGSFEQITGPVTTGSEETTEQGEPVSGDFELDTNIEDPEWTIDVTDGINEDAGELEIEGASWNFTPAEDFTGEASFTFTANDGQLTTVPATVTIQVGDPAEDEEGKDDEDSGDEEGSGGGGDEDTTPPEDGGGDAPSEGDKVELSVDSDEVAAGDQLTLVGEGFEAGEDVVFELNPELGTFPADDDGVVTAEVTIPEDTEPGEHTITATGQSSGSSDSVTVTVVEPTEAAPAGDISTDDDEPAAKAPAAADAADEELAATGMTSRNAGLLSGLLLLVGGGLAALGYKNRLGRRNADA